jgi:hypothetical protein
MWGYVPGGAGIAAGRRAAHVRHVRRYATGNVKAQVYGLTAFVWVVGLIYLFG